MEFVYFMRPKREKFMENMNAEEKAVMENQQAYCRRMITEGSYVSADFCRNGAFGFFVFNAESREAAEQIFENDPAIKAGFMNAELHIGIHGYSPAFRGETTLLLNSMGNN